LIAAASHKDIAVPFLKNTQGKHNTRGDAEMPERDRDTEDGEKKRGWKERRWRRERTKRKKPLPLSSAAFLLFSLLSSPYPTSYPVDNT
jgi:hypothetical protein